LTKDQDFKTIVGTLVDIGLVGGVGKTKFRAKENGIDMLFPEATGFGMSLKGTEHGNDMGTINGYAFAGEIPISKLIANPDKSRHLRARGVGIGIADVALVDNVIQSGRHSHEEALGGLTDTGGVSLGQVAQSRSTTGRAIATTTGSALARGLDGVVPERANDGTNARFRRRARSTMHAKEVKTVQLFMFTSAPFRPRTQFLEFVPGERANAAFFGCRRGGLERVEELINFVDREVLDIIVINEH
jgi:hypothetical protein